MINYAVTLGCVVLLAPLCMWERLPVDPMEKVAQNTAAQPYFPNKTVAAVKHDFWSLFSTVYLLSAPDTRVHERKSRKNMF